MGNVCASNRDKGVEVTGPDTQTLAQAWFYQYCWGFSTVPAAGTADDRNMEMLGYAQSLCNAIAADGEASDAEIAWVQGYLANKGYGKLAHEVEVMAKAAESKTIDQMVADTKKAMDVGTLKFAGSAVIFDSIRAAMVDGLDDKEWTATVAMAGAFGLSAEKIEELKELAMEEEAFRAKKARIVTPGHPCLDVKYQ